MFCTVIEPATEFAASLGHVDNAVTNEQGIGTSR
jgi:hypothetical protein